MIVVPMNPNAVYIRMVSNGCLKAGFDTTYPIQLNNIIRQDEFQQSIENINRAFSSKKLMFIVTIIFIMCILGGMGMLIGGGLMAVNSGTTGFPVLVGVGIGVFFFGMIFLSVGCCIVQSQQSKRMRQAIATESAKYTVRSPVPCSWRLDVTRAFTGGGGYGNRRGSAILYHLIIDIGKPVGPNGGTTPYQYNQGNSYPSSFVSQQNNFSPPPPYNNLPPPPPYSSQPPAAFCPRCGMTRQNSTMKFCSSCGQAFPQ